jgi:transcriptional regulator with XRE-family HTH domain
MFPIADTVLLSQARRKAQDGRACELRIAAGLSQSEVAATVGVTSAAISHWENGRRVPRGQAARRYAQLLDSLASAGREG